MTSQSHHSAFCTDMVKGSVAPVFKQSFTLSVYSQYSTNVLICFYGHAWSIHKCNDLLLTELDGSISVSISTSITTKERDYSLEFIARNPLGELWTESYFGHTWHTVPSIDGWIMEITIDSFTIYHYRSCELLGCMSFGLRHLLSRLHAQVCTPLCLWSLLILPYVITSDHHVWTWCSSFLSYSLLLNHCRNVKVDGITCWVNL